MTPAGVQKDPILQLQSVSEYERVYAPLFSYSPRMSAVRLSIERVADTDVTVLVRGESGVGKEVVAKAIHAASSRRNRPFVKVNCAALPSELLESELFGHEKGAFTGAFRQKPGRFELAHQGTIFLDEIGDMPIALQAKLLHVLQDGEFGRVGGCERLKVNVRVIASTNRPLEEAMRRGQFREDLYYRLNVVTLKLPPLRERREEIPVLAETFLRRFNEQYGRKMSLGPECLHALMQYAWPGNVREIENVIKRVVVLEDTDFLTEELVQPAEPQSVPATPAPGNPDPCRNLKDITRQAALNAERQVLKEVLDQVRWNRAEAARIFRISYKALLYKIDRCGLDRKRGRRPLPDVAEGAGAA